VDARQPSRPTICLAGHDARGALFAAGRLLRLLDLGRDKVQFDRTTSFATAPQVPLRGHQLGYRPKTNSYDAWTLAMWEQYFRDMIVFGMNAVELIPPRSDDDGDSPHFPTPPMDMMVAMSQLASDYGLEVWVWYPAIDKDYGIGPAGAGRGFQAAAAPRCGLCAGRRPRRYSARGPVFVAGKD
jgi:hypothetical protein